MTSPSEPECPYVASRSDNVHYQCTLPLGHEGPHRCHDFYVPPRAFRLPIYHERDDDLHAVDVWHVRYDDTEDGQR